MSELTYQRWVAITRGPSSNIDKYLEALRHFKPPEHSLLDGRVGKSKLISFPWVSRADPLDTTFLMWEISAMLFAWCMGYVTLVHPNP